MSGLLAGRSALVTGAGQGIGRATALELAGDGAQVAVNDIDPEAVNRVVAEIAERGGRAIPAVGSVSEASAVDGFAREAFDAFGAIDILVNNAGVAWQGEIEELGPDEFERVTATHIKGTYHCTRRLVPSMRARGYGRIINLVSRAGIHGMPGTLAYAVGKGGVFGFTNAASRDLHPHGITVNAVNPGSTATPMVLSAVEALEARGEEGRARAANLRRTMQAPEQVAVVIAALATAEAGAINGQVFLVEGNRVGVFEPLRVTDSVDRDEPWDLASLADAITRLETPRVDDPYG